MHDLNKRQGWRGVRGSIKQDRKSTSRQKNQLRAPLSLASTSCEDFTIFEVDESHGRHRYFTGPPTAPATDGRSSPRHIGGTSLLPPIQRYPSIRLVQPTTSAILPALIHRGTSSDPAAVRATQVGPSGRLGRGPDHLLPISVLWLHLCLLRLLDCSKSLMFDFSCSA